MNDKNLAKDLRFETTYQENGAVDNKRGYVYVVSNPAFPELIKIGMTGLDDFTKRLKQLYNTSVPFPFECHYAGRVRDRKRAEDALHDAFEPERENPNREFFRISKIERVVNLLKLFSEDVTDKAVKLINETSNDSDKKSGSIYQKKRRPKINFYEIGLKRGSVLIFNENGKKVEAKVFNERQIEFEGKAQSLTALTRDLLQWQSDRQPTPYWTFEGRSLFDIYEEKYTDKTDEE
jgi:hypothetical protein